MVFEVSEGLGGSPPPFGMVVGAAGAAQTLKIDDSRPIKNPCIKNSAVHWKGVISEFMATTHEAAI